jgi:uncharacterized membrane protein
MSRVEFLRILERGLKALPDIERDAILADYQRYFADGSAAGRKEEEVATSLGNPKRLAAELRLGHDVQAWSATEGSRSPLGTLKSMLALVLLDGVLWLPALAAVLLVLLALGAGFTALLYGMFTLAVEPFDHPLGGIAAALLRAVGWLSAGAALLLISNASIHALASLFVRARHARERSPVPPEVSP